MGNSASNSESEDEFRVENKEEDPASDTEADGEKDGRQTVDLSILFNHSALRTAASKLKDDMPENVIQQHHSLLLHWLEDRMSRNEETVLLSQFCDVLMNRSVGREECVQAFQQFDTEGDGTADVTTMLEALRQSNGANMHGELSYVIRTLQACSLTPGFIDVYSEGSHSIGQHGSRILNFLLRNRAPSSSLPFPIIEGFNNTCSMRLSVLKSLLHKLGESYDRSSQESMLSSGEELKSITKCYTAMDVSTGKNDMHRMVNGDFSSYWQSDGTARAHWIRLHIKNNVVIKQLSVGVASSDQSYMPQLITVSVGKSALSLREIREVRIPSHITGDVTLLKNAKQYYPIIQLNIRRCHSDGCDTRIHSLKTLGYKIVKDAGMSVSDASAVWYLQVLASTTTACLPVSPQLRDMVLEHSRNALCHMPPLALSPNSAERPAFLSSHVLKQMDTFLGEVAIEKESHVSADALYVLLSFNLARGHVMGILKTLKLLQDSEIMEIEALPLLKSMVSVRDSFWKKQGGPLQLTLAGCDGGQKDEAMGPENVLSVNWATPGSKVYQSAEGKTLVNMIFKASDFVQVTKIKIKVEKGPCGAKSGFIFVYKDESGKPFSLEDHVEKFKTHDTWGFAEYCLHNNGRTSGLESTSDNPVAHFATEEDWDEIEIPLDVFPVGQYVQIKFLQPRQSTAGRIGVVGVKFYGFTRKAVFADDLQVAKSLDLSQDSSVVSKEMVFVRTLSFLVDLAREQGSGKQGKPQPLDMSALATDVWWKLYPSFSYNSDAGVVCKILLLQLLHALFQPLTVAKTVKTKSVEYIFQHLCEVIDTQDQKEEESPMMKNLVKMAQQCVIDGAAVFFPDKEARRKQLFNMMDTVTGTVEKPSVSLIFQSLCQFYGNMEPSGLLDLPQYMKRDYNSEPVVAVMETLMSVAFKEFQTVVSGGADTDEMTPLVQLLCSLQTTLLGWCYRQLDTPDLEEESKDIILATIVRYYILLGEKATEACKLLLEKKEEIQAEMIPKLKKSFLSATVREGLLVLGMMSDKLDSAVRVALLHKLLPIAEELRKMAQLLPHFFHTIDSDHWQKVHNDSVVLRTWDVESSHNYENNQHTTQIFSCPGATTFVVEFDKRCETEKRYDFLEFTDCRGVRTRYDQKVGTEKWPKTVTFRGGHRLQFLFRSDSSNNEWGYKFKVTAMGCPDSPICWVFDLQLGLSKLFGKLCGCTLNLQKLMPKPPDPEKQEEDQETAMLKSELWTTLFRGGYMVGKLQRSLSGRQEAIEGNHAVCTFLWDIVQQKPGPATKLINKCLEHCSSPRSKIGGDDITQAVVSAFAALLWHTQPLREEIEKHVEGKEEVAVSEGIHQAFHTAESLRHHLMDLRQKQTVAAEKEGSSKAAIEDPVKSCKEKAEFLLKFAGLTKVQLKLTENKASKNKNQRKVLNRKFSGEMDRIFKVDLASDKYPSFRLVMEFIRDPAWLKEKVQQLLQERSKQAQSVAEVYMFAAEYIRMMADQHIFQVPVVLFLQELLDEQNHFPKHYADWLDGCGLELESNVRQAYYTVLRRLVESLRNNKKFGLKGAVEEAYEFIQACLLHLLDMNWQPYDLAFLVDLKIPELLMNIAKGSVTTRDKSLSEFDESQEQEEYEQCMKWLEECKTGFSAWYKTAQESSKEDRKAMQMFVARFCDLLDVEISCDGCGVTLPGRRYRCLQCQDMDLCATCFAGGVKPAGEHTDDHDIVHLMYKCDECQAFIVGQRIHCDVCEDFDLCLGCHKKELYPPGHDSSHRVSVLPLVKLKSTNKNESSLQAYIHQHVWLLFTSLSLAMAEVLYHRHSELDHDYVECASKLHCQCVELVTQCLKEVPEGDSTHDIDVESKELEEEAAIKRQDLAFAVHSQERIMGLLGAMLPPDNRVVPDVVINTFDTEEFLKLLFTIGKGDSGHESSTQHLAMGLIAQLLKSSSTSCKIADAAVAGAMDPDELTATEGPDGERTVSFLFSFGATCMERSGLEWACSMANILQGLVNAVAWRDSLLSHITNSIQSLREKEVLDLSSIFALFVIAGFPEVLSIGNQVKYNENSTEARLGVVLKHYPDKHMTLLIDTKSRKRHSLKDEYVECVCHEINVLDMHHISSFIGIVRDLIIKFKKGDGLSVEKTWVLSLALKSLLQMVKSPSFQDGQSQEVFTSDVIQCLVQLASQGTGFSKQWLLKDLEVLSLMLYTQDKEKTDVPAPLPVPVPATSDPRDPWQGLDEPAKMCFQTLHEHFHVPIPILRAIYDMHGQNTNALLMAVQENIEGDSYNPSEGIKKLAKKWESGVKAVASEVMADKAIDAGILQIDLAVPVKRTIDKATEEPSEDAQKLIKSTDNDTEIDVLKQRRSKSASLLKKELEVQGKTGSREYLKKVNLAMSILWARKVLLSLLADWPQLEYPITSDLLGCRSNAQIPCVLDLLNRSECKQTFRKVVNNVIQHCESSCLPPIASTACQFMEEVTMATNVRQSEHPYEGTKTVEEKIHIPGAAFLSIKFDSKCATEEDADEVVMASTADYKQDKHVFSGNSKNTWKDFDMPGDTLYFKFTTEGGYSHWGYKFTISSGKIGRFDTGYLILNAILSNEMVAVSLPLNDLWCSLVYVACKQTGTQRLKTIQLLLRILQTQFVPRADPQKCRVDLTLLKPLWKLYKSSFKDTEGGSVTQPIVRALTELFLVAENTALDLGIVEEYVVALFDLDEIRKVVYQGLHNVAALGAAIGLPNKATEAFQSIKPKAKKT